MPEITPPIFVLYDNGGLVVFDTIGDAEGGVPPPHFAHVQGVWDRRGSALVFDGRSAAAPPLRIAARPHELTLREALVHRFEQAGEREASLWDDDKLADRAHGAFGLLDDAAVRTIGTLNWVEAVLQFFSVFPR